MTQPDKAKRTKKTCAAIFDDKDYKMLIRSLKNLRKKGIGLLIVRDSIALYDYNATEEDDKVITSL